MNYRLTFLIVLAVLAHIKHATAAIDTIIFCIENLLVGIGGLT